MAVSPMLIKVAAALLTSEKGSKGVGFLLVAIFAPVILIAAILCSTTSGAVIGLIFFLATSISPN